MDQLTVRQREIAELVWRGYSNEEIASALVIEVGTVKRHLHDIYTVLGIDDRVALAVLYERWALDHLPTAERTLYPAIHDGRLAGGQAGPARWGEGNGANPEQRRRRKGGSMFLPGSLLAKIILGAVLLAGAGGAATAVLLSSGPFTNDDDNNKTVQAQNSPTAQSQPTAADAIDDPYPPDHVFQPTEIIDFNRLPSVDTAGWTTVTAIDKTMQATLPPNWRLTDNSPVKDTSGKAIGAHVGAATLEVERPAEGKSNPGWSMMDISSEPFDVPGIPWGRPQILQTSRIAGNVDIEAVQFGANPDLPEVPGVVSLTVDGSGGPESNLNGALTVQLPATANDVAVAVAIARSIRIQK